MAGTPFEYYGENALTLNNFAEIAGRYSFQRQAEQYLLQYLLEKLSLSPDDDVLEIGCGAGNLLIPLSFFVRSATGIDHPNLLAKLKSRVPKDHDTLTLIPGEFPKAKVPGTYSRVLIYSVIHYLRNEKEVLTFIKKAVARLRPGGILLIGDIPNKDIKARFLASKRGKVFVKEWQKQMKRERKKNPQIHQSMPAASLVGIDDTLLKKIVSVLRKSGLRATRVRQPETLAFGFTREDIIAIKE